MKTYFHPADILLPDFNKVDGSRWSVIACDQFTSEPEYWQEAETLVGDSASTLRLILPEAFLEETESRVPQINNTMREYLDSVFSEHKSAMIYVERTQSNGEIRRGIVGAIDLEYYSYLPGESSLIRATEGTVLERIPPRVAIRRYAAVELPHVMLLIDDPERRVIEPLSDLELPEAYSFPLMLGGGSIRGGFLPPEQVERVNAELANLFTPEALQDRYGFVPNNPMLFAAGDGNHSLAAAKASYEELKAAIGDPAYNHPARYALVEVVNLHDESLRFEPIYRVVFDVDPEMLILELRKYCEALRGNAKPQTIEFISAGERGTIRIESPIQQLPVGTLQTFIDKFCEKHPEATVDYIHDEDSARRIACRENAVGFIFDGMGKDQLFSTVMLDGALPRKTFSMGHARDKRYYLEARRIKK